ncbi:MAG TPA: hypothetical protein GX700_02750 [Paracoccus sp.]|nr:hypothetical protein [Paracoccus sp. (in: a-proteobacteria)]
MQRTSFDERTARVLASHVATRRRKERKPAHRVLAIFGVLAATVFCFFLLKGAALAWQGGDIFAAGPPPDSSSLSLRLWLTGVDPVTRLIADLLAGTGA